MHEVHRIDGERPTWDVPKDGWYRRPKRICEGWDLLTARERSGEELRQVECAYYFLGTESAAKGCGTWNVPTTFRGRSWWCFLESAYQFAGANSGGNARLAASTAERVVSEIIPIEEAFSTSGMTTHTKL
jgi:hypothetical protein